MSEDPVFAFADYVCATRYEDLPASAREATKRDLLDTFGCALGGSGAPGIDALLKLHRGWGGRAHAVRPIDAAMVGRAADLLDGLDQAPDITALTRMFA